MSTDVSSKYSKIFPRYQRNGLTSYSYLKLLQDTMPYLRSSFIQSTLTKTFRYLTMVELPSMSIKN